MTKRIVLQAIAVMYATAGMAAAGTVTGVTVAPTSVATGVQASFTVVGTNPCGAAHLIYGDGTAITYPITGLPTTQTHAYDKPGSYTVVAKGMGNCDGEATTTVTVTGAPIPPAQPVAQITAVEIAPNPARVREPVTIAVNGSGTCAYEVHYGDGNAQEVNGRLPQQFRHVYATPQTYTVIVKPNPPCTGKFTEQLHVTDPTVSVPRIARILVAPTPADAGQPVMISVEGTGTCAYTIDYGDGNTETRARDLPDRLHHAYPPGTYTVAAIPDAPCTGSVRARLDVRGTSTAGVTGVEATPSPVTAGMQISIQIKGTGTCNVTLDFGDGNNQAVSGELPRRVTHTYPAAGIYTIRADADRPCSGSLWTTLQVLPRR